MALSEKCPLDIVCQFDVLIDNNELPEIGVAIRGVNRIFDTDELGIVNAELVEDKTKGNHIRSIGVEKLTRPQGQNTKAIYAIGHELDGEYVDMLPDDEIDWGDRSLKNEEVFSNNRPLEDEDFRLMTSVLNEFERALTHGR